CPPITRTRSRTATFRSGRTRSRALPSSGPTSKAAAMPTSPGPSPTASASSSIRSHKRAGTRKRSRWPPYGRQHRPEHPGIHFCPDGSHVLPLPPSRLTSDRQGQGGPRPQERAGEVEPAHFEHQLEGRLARRVAVVEVVPEPPVLHGDVGSRR